MTISGFQRYFPARLRATLSLACKCSCPPCGLRLAEKTLVYVVVDQGFNLGESGHRYAPFVFLATNDKLVNRNGTREDIAPTVLKRFGVDLTKIQPSLDGIPLGEPTPERKAPTENPNPRPGLARQTASQD